MYFSTFLEEYSTLWLNCFDGNTTLERHRPAAVSQSSRGRVTIVSRPRHNFASAYRADTVGNSAFVK